MTPPGRRGACLRCAQIKQACDGATPCSRCLRLNLASSCCPKSSFSGAQPVPAEKLKAQIRRVQTGCLTCKKRKKKCDERKPRCGDCARLCLECLWLPGRGSRGWRRRRSSSSDGNSNSNSSPSSSLTSLGELLGGSVSHGLELEIGAGYGMATAGGDGMRQPSFVGGGAGPDFVASAEDITWGLSSSHPLLDITSQTLPFPMSPSSDSFTPDSASTSPSPSLYVPSTVPDLTSADDKALLNHFSTIVASVLSRQPSPHSNPYITHLLPMALSNDLVLHCVLALSANHWHRLQPRMKNRGLLHKSRATKSLAGLLPHVDRTSADVALASCLLLCMTELFDGTSSGWKLHLEGAKRLLAALELQHGDSRAPTSCYYKFLVRLSRFLDSATTTTTCKPPLIRKEEATERQLHGLVTAPDGEDAAVYGIPKELFHLVDRVNGLAHKRKTRLDEASEAAFLHEASVVGEQLDHWSFEYGGLNPAVSTLSPANSDVLHATTAFEWALRLRLHQIIEGYMLTDPKVSQAVTKILDSVQKIRYGSPLEGCLLFPLVMAGGACLRLEHRVIVQDRLMVMERTCGFGYVYHARELVERVWERRDRTEGTGAIINWARIRYEEMGGLAVF